MNFVYLQKSGWIGHHKAKQNKPDLEHQILYFHSRAKSKQQQQKWWHAIRRVTVKEEEGIEGKIIEVWGEFWKVKNSHSIYD